MAQPSQGGSQACRHAYVQTCTGIHCMRKSKLTGTSKKLGDLGVSKGGTSCDGYEEQVTIVLPREKESINRQNQSRLADMKA